MQFQTFCLFAQNSELAIQELLKLSRYEPTPSLLNALAQCYQKAGENVSCRVVTTKGFDDTQVRLVAGQLGVDNDTLSTAIKIYQTYSRLQSIRQQLSPRLFEELIEFHLTGGGRNPDYCALWDGSIVHWDPIHKMLGFSVGDNEMYNECCEYLIGLNRSFCTLDQLIEYAKTHDWPNWDRIEERYHNPWSE